MMPVPLERPVRHVVDHQVARDAFRAGAVVVQGVRNGAVRSPRAAAQDDRPPFLIVLGVLALPILFLLFVFGLPIMFVLLAGGALMGLLFAVLSVGLVVVKLAIVIGLPIYLMWKLFSWLFGRRR